ncbi:MAG: helix-turn-helix domain-containing protein [Bacteroidia bacterium]|nr:helix-turn-helix domain-containing protein [Bacteroidia bacterium]
MSLINANIKYLRKQKGLTQEELAQNLEVSRSVIGAYEEGRAEPKLNTMQNIANFFGVSLDQLATLDLSQVAERSIRNTQEAPHWEVPEPSTDVEGKKLRVLSITVDSNDRENIELVPVKAAAGYLNGYADPEYLEELPRFHLPMLPQGSYRAFEIKGDSMLPLPSGAIIVGEYVENWRNMRDGEACILVTGSDGIVFKRVYNKLSTEGKLTLKSDNPAYPAYDVSVEDVMEVWRARAYISTSFPDPELSLTQLAGIVLDLQQEVIKLKK